MNRAAAAEKIAKLRALGDPARGGTPAERAAANRKADDLAARYGVDEAPAQDFYTKAKAHMRGEWVAPRRGPAWYFDIRDGSHSPNVRVHHYAHRGNWRIEVDPY